MRSFLMIAVLASALGAAAQTPAAPVPTKPRLALTTTAFEDGGIIPDTVSYTHLDVYKRQALSCSCFFLSATTWFS